MIFTGRGEAERLSGALFLTFLKMSEMFPYFQSPGSSPDCHVFSNIMENGLTVPSGLWDLMRCIP